MSVIGGQGTSISVDGGINKVPDTPPPPTFALGAPAFAADPQATGGSAAISWNIQVGNLNTTVLGGAAPSQITGGSGAASIVGGSAPTTITGGSGPDTLVGGTGPTTIAGGSGPTTITGGSGAASIFGGSGTNLIYGGTGPETITGGSGPNMIYGGGLLDAILGGGIADRTATADTIFGGAGPTTIIGGTGPSTIIGGSGPTTIIAHDTLSGSGSTLIADQGNVIHDTVYGFNQGAGDAISFAGENAQTIAAVVGSAQVIGGNTTITLPDNSTITLIGITHLDGSFFR